MVQNHPLEKEMQKGKAVVGERERYTLLNAELQRRARRDKKVFLNKQCKETEVLTSFLSDHYFIHTSNECSS